MPSYTVTCCQFFRSFFFFIVSATPEIYTLSLHDALPILAVSSTPQYGTSLCCKTQEGDTEWFLVHCTARMEDRKSTRLNSSHVKISYAVFCLKKKNKKIYSNGFYRCKVGSS